MEKAFDKKVHSRVFKEGDLVLKKILLPHLDSRGKWTPNYEGPYVVKKHSSVVVSSSQQWMGKNCHIQRIQMQSKNTMYKKLAKFKP